MSVGAVRAAAFRAGKGRADPGRRRGAAQCKSDDEHEGSGETDRRGRKDDVSSDHNGSMCKKNAENAVQMLAIFASRGYNCR